MTRRLLTISLAFAAIYVIWGSTYLAIRVAIETLPPLTMAAARFLIAGSLLWIWCELRGVERAGRGHWRSAAIIGTLMLLGGNGGVCWVEQYVASGIASLVVALVPFWMVLLHWARRGGARPTVAEVCGLLLGFVGMVILADPGAAMPETAMHRGSIAVLLIATLAWAVGSLYSRTAARPGSPLRSTAMEMLAGGLALAIAGAGLGEWRAIDPATFSIRSLAAVGYLVVFGSVVAFTAYMWLLRVSTPARVATYAYVNPIVAVFLGWWLVGEQVTARTLVAAVVILLGVAVIITFGRSYRSHDDLGATGPVRVAVASSETSRHRS